MDLIIGGAPVTAAAGACYFCRHFSNPDPKEQKWVRTGVSVDYEGEIVICINCAGLIAQTIGSLTPEASDKLRETNRTLRAKNKELGAKALAFDTFRARIEEINAELPV